MNNKTFKAVISKKPYPVPIELRPLWRICLIIIAIVEVAGEKKYLDIKKINILVWMLIRRNKWEEYTDYLSGDTKELPLISVDTVTYRAIEYAIAKDFIRLENGRLYLNEKGEEIHEILVNNEILNSEIHFLKESGRKLTTKKVKQLTGEYIECLA